MTTARDLLGRLFEYIAEQARDVDPRAFNLSRLANFFLREPAQLLGLPGLEFDQADGGEPLWLRVPRLEPVAAPAVAERFAALISVSADPGGPPPALDPVQLALHLEDIAGFAQHLAPTTAAAPGSATSRALAVQDMPALPADEALRRRIVQAQARFRDAVQAAFDDISARWLAWAEAEAPRRLSMQLYGELFALMHQLQAQQTGKPVELVWGLGVATWRLRWESEDFTFRYPLLTQAVELSLDAATLALEVRPRTTAPRLELDALIACLVPGACELEQTGRDWLAQHAQEVPPSPFHMPALQPLLRRIAGSLDSQGRFLDVLASGAPVPNAGAHLVVTDAWALFARPQSYNFLVDDLRRLRLGLEAAQTLPGGPAALVTPPDDAPAEVQAVRFRGLSSRGEGEGTSDGDGPARELYFPLPYNQEQVTIVQRLERSDGVTVQGPPGTGKTHTIANIICHYLATGRRVLVTSRGEPALQVLQAKIPAEVRPLTVALLSSDREGLRQFQGAIEAIQHRVSQLDPLQAQRRIATAHEAIALAHAELSRLDRRVDDIARAQLASVDLDGTPLRAQQLAELVRDGQARFAWFDDELPAGAPPAPLTEDEARELREARRRLGEDLRCLAEPPPSSATLPAPDVLAPLHQALQRLRRIEGELARGALPALQGEINEARALLAAVEAALEPAQALEHADQAWAQALRRQLSEPGFEAERQALQSLLVEVPRLAAARGDFLQRPVDMPQEALACVRTREAVERAARTGKAFNWLPFGEADARRHVAAMRVDGREPATRQDWLHVARFLALQMELQSLLVRWQRLAPELGLPELHQGAGALRKLERLALIAGLALRLSLEVDAELPRRAAVLLSANPLPAPGSGAVATVEHLQRLQKILRRHVLHEALAGAPRRQQALLLNLTAGGPLGAQWQELIGQWLGRTDVESDAFCAREAALRAETQRLAALQPALECVRVAAQRLAAAGAARLAQRLRSEPAEGAAHDAVLPTDWRAAWTWARARAALQTLEGRGELTRLWARRAELEQGLSKLYEDVVARAAWLATRMNASPKVLSALAGYANALHRIGQGTGPNAARYRRDAQAAMLDAAPAVPCWIMSHARVSESMPADIGAFDLVIVDEASQSDLWALPAIARGKKILVVGDHKQVSPEGGFISSARINDLRQRFLADQPFAAAMTPEKSLYDLAAQVFAGQQVMLREHFRCVAPIIEYANRNFYDHGVLPLRVPRAAERIDPPLVDLFVEEGRRDHRDRNDAEAQAIADEIAALLADERLAGRTLGVVSLLGLEQARHIDAVVRARFDAAELLRRQFACGDARTFQGSERDVMFLSLVVDARQCRALAGNGADQRFNVAASRARDRMVLVRSVRMDELSEKDLRRTLLAHFENPLPGGGHGHEDGRPLRALCESGFEREVFDALVQRGYRVRPQVRAGAYRIDMVVEGAHDARLAVECDGDAFHGPERWQQDVARQRVLERAGWVFWRCFASTWTLHREEVLAELLARLAELDIAPLGAAEGSLSLLVEPRTWRAPAPSEQVQQRLREAVEAGREQEEA
ncbi:AAA domain-containing protein [Azohydromonas lata]|uniref:AAA domain-containing protein n=1 Tax=Azohydromonas lata TaxID=45677 RepID=A0ABU5II17_9BURK|nr:AAA domain-containing protein [Azohydromonas lata]MDZ5458791.1 AAA domain-containing protein [Azohydromonas lata]